MHHIASFHWDSFHWLSPHWLWGLIPLWVLGIGIVLLDKEQHKWQSYIANHLKSQVIQKGKGWKNHLPILVFLWFSSSLVISLAQPTWEKVKSPEVKLSSQAIIAMEISPSMLTNDLEPNRLERAKLKVSELLKANPRVKVGLHVFGGSPHIVLPPTQDYRLIEHHVKSFTTKMMPVEGEDLELYIQLIADSSFKRIKAASTLILITDSWDPQSDQAVAQFIQTSNHKVKVLLVQANQDGAQSSHERIELIPMTLDTTDVAHIAETISATKTFTKKGEEIDDQWMDMGWFLLLPALFLALFFFRKGFTVLPTLFFVATLTGCSYDSPLAPYLYDHDSIGQAFYKEGNYEKTLEYCDDPALRAAAYYQLGDFESAAQLYQLDSSQEGTYNQAVSLVALGYYDSALVLLDDLELDSVKFNQISSFIEARQAEVLNFKEDVEHSKQQESLEERKASGKDEELSSDTETDELPKSGKRVTDEVESDVHKAKELEFPPEQANEPQEMEQKSVLLQKANPDPSEFLRKRFKLQQKRRTKENG